MGSGEFNADLAFSPSISEIHSEYFEANLVTKAIFVAKLPFSPVNCSNTKSEITCADNLRSDSLTKNDLAPKSSFFATSHSRKLTLYLLASS